MVAIRGLLNIILAVLALSGCVNGRQKLPAPASTATVWNFDNSQNPFSASTGTAKLGYRDTENTDWGPVMTRFTKASALGLPPIPGGDASVMEFPATKPDQGYTVTHNSLPNGVFAIDGFVSNYTLIMDMLWPSESFSLYRSFYQTDTENADDAELFAEDKVGGGIGISWVYDGSITPGAWHRVAVAVQCALGPGGTGRISKFIDGRFVGGHFTPGDGSRCRWALGPVFHLFSDNDGETAKGYVSSIMYTDRFMSMNEIGALGGPTAAGANVAGPTPLAKSRLAKKRVSIIAHRGNSCCAPENTLAAISQAFNKGADIIEVDIKVSADGVAFLMHDEDLERTTDGSGHASHMNISELKELDAGSWFDNRYAGQSVPTLAEALIAAKGRGKLLLDVKSIDAGTAIKRALNQAGVSSDVIWLSQNKSDEGAEDFRKNIPGAGVVWGDLPATLDTTAFTELKKKGVVGFDVDVDLATRKFVEAAHANGMFVSVYIVLDPDSMVHFIDMGVDAMETDYPAVLNSIMPPRPSAP